MSSYLQLTSASVFLLTLNINLLVLLLFPVITTPNDVNQLFCCLIFIFFLSIYLFVYLFFCSWDFIYAEYVMAAGHNHRSIVWQVAFYLGLIAFFSL